MSDIIHPIPEQAEPGPGTRLSDPSNWVLGERIHDSQVLHAYRSDAGLVWVLADLSQRQAMEHRNSALAELSHPQIQGVAGTGSLGGRPYRADPDVDGVPLDVICREQGPFTVERSLNIALQLAEILVELHGRGIVHGHVHPGATHLNKEQITLGDIPPLLGLDLPYAAPEVQLGAQADPRSDLFGLGYVTLCLLQGSRPDGEGRDKTWRTGEPGTIASLPPSVELPQEIAQLLLSMVDRDPERRPSSALEVSLALARARAPSRKPPSLKVVGLALGGVLLFAGLNLAYEHFASPKTPVTPEGAELTSDPSTPDLSHFSGNYTGTANGRPLRIELSVDAGGKAHGVTQHSFGAQQVREPLSGTFAASGSFTLVEMEGPHPNTWSGTQQGDTLNGQLSSGGRSLGQWSASRQTLGQAR
jgi:serine/threonine protein kinase